MSELVPNRTSRSGAVAPGTLASAVLPIGNGDQPSAESIDLKTSLSTVRRHPWLVIGTAVVVVALTGFWLKRQGHEYQATAVIRLVDARRELAGDLDDAAQQRSITDWTDPIASQLQVLQSRAVAGAVVDSQPLGLEVQVAGFPASVLRNVSVSPNTTGDSVGLRFAPDRVTIASNGAAWTAPYNASVRAAGITFVVGSRPPNVDHGALYLRSRADATNLLLSALRARARDRTDVVDVSYVAADPFVAQQVVNAVVQAFQIENAKRAQQQSHRRRIFVQAQLDQTDSLLQVAQDRLSQYRTDHKVYGSSDAVVAAEQTGLLNVEVQRQSMVADRRVYQSLLDELARDDTAPERQKTLRALVASPGIADNPVAQAIYAQLVGYQASLDSASTGRWASASTNPDVLRLRSLVAGAQDQLADAVESQITSLDARVAALDELQQRNASALKSLPATQAGEARLVGQVESTRKMADQLREEYQKARIAEAVEAGQVEIVDLATAPTVPVGMSRKAKLLTGIIIGLLLGIGTAFVAERLNTAICRREDIENVLRIPGLAIIPRIVPPGSIRHLKMGNVSLQIPTTRRAWTTANGDSLVTVTDIRSSSAEAFRSLRTSLIFSQVVQSLHTIVITSPSPQDGKTTTAANLAVTFAQQGMRALLVDCDLRRARLHKLFHTQREPGLTQFMLGEATLQQVLQPTAIDGLTLLPASTHPPNPSELLGGPLMHSTLETLRREFEIIILDSPPIHAAADALILGSQADGIILVLRAGHTDRQVAQDAVQRLAAVGVRVVGAVLNDPDHKVPQYGGYYYYYDYYGSAET